MRPGADGIDVFLSPKFIIGGIKGIRPVTGKIEFLTFIFIEVMA